MGFYLSECTSEIRRLLNDTNSSSYRYTTVQIEDYARDTLSDILRLRPDAAIGEDGTVGSYLDLYDYTESAQVAVLDEFQRITGWDKLTYPVAYLKATSASVITVYPSDTDRTNGTNSLATISGADSVGIKAVAAANSSGWGGVVKVTYPATNGQSWNLTVTEVELFDRIFRNAFIYNILHKCFLADSEDTGDAGRAVQYAQLFTQHLGV